MCIRDRDAIGFRVRIAVCIRPCVGLRAVSGFDNDLFGEDVLLFKQHVERTLHLVQRELSLMESRENGDQDVYKRQGFSCFCSCLTYSSVGISSR